MRRRRELQIALDKYENEDKTNKKDIEDDINLFHVKLAEKKVKYWARDFN